MSGRYMIPRIRIDDVLQTKWLTFPQLDAVKVRPMFEWFKMTTQVDKPYILAIVAEGIDSQPEWVEYIREHPQWELQCHGWEHILYCRLPKTTIVEELKRAKEKIEKIFNRDVQKYYPPKMKYNDVSRKAAKEAGMEETRERWTLKQYLDKEVENPNEIYFHYWSPRLWLASAEDF